MDIKNARMKYGFTKAIDAEKKTVMALVSTYQWDRTSERFEFGAWDMANYKMNPVVLWGHDSSQPPIGKCIQIDESNEGLIAVTQFNEKDDDAMEIFNLYQDGYLNGFSVGFIPKEFKLEPLTDGSQDKGIVFTKAELLEYSAVTIPCNPGAIVSGKMAERVLKILGKDSLDVLEINGETVHMAPIGASRLQSRKEMIATVPVGSIEDQLKYIQTLAKASKRIDTDENKIALVKNTIGVLSELLPIAPVEPALTQDQLDELNKGVSGLMGALKPENMNRQLETEFQKTINQFTSALRGRAD